jgi:hypothetical protein
VQLEESYILNILSLGTDVVILSSFETGEDRNVQNNISVSYRVLRPPLWPSGQSSWLQIRRPGLDSRHYQKKKVVGLERGPLSLVSTTEELLRRKSSGCCLENREYGPRDPSR